MKAVVIHAAHDLRVEERPSEAVGPGQLRVAIERGGICGSDLHYYSHGGFGAVRLREPMILGHEVSGRVVECGPGVTGLEAGDLVAVSPSRPCGGCAQCHAGYGWEDANFDFTNQENIDCLVCHDQTGTYVKSNSGLPSSDVDLLAVAQSVANPTRSNCGGCHFNGGGGNAVKHGDLDGSLYFPTENIDIHMGRYDFDCVDCHKTEDHNITGRAMSVSVDNNNQVFCTDCHSESVHQDERINAHTDTLACQTCHIPEVAVKQATKTHWDWSTAGDDEKEEDVHHYLKIKGSFIYQRNLKPEYRWYNGLAERYLLGDPISSEGATPLNAPKGDIRDPDARIWPFKIHHAKQPYDADLAYLLQPVTSGEGGFWNEFKWDQALRLGAEVTGLPYSGEYGFADTDMFWPQTHMVAPKNRALQCQACHAENGRMDWRALGYDGDPIKQGSQSRKRTPGLQAQEQQGADHE